MNENGEVVDLEPGQMQKIIDEKIIGDFAKNYGYRTLAYAYKDMDSDHWEDLQAENNNFAKESDRDIIESDLIFVAGFGLRDDLREGVL